MIALEQTNNTIMGLFNWLFGNKDIKCTGCGYSIHKNRSLCVKCQNLKKEEKIKLEVKKSPKVKVSKSKKHVINENNKQWLDLVDARVKSMPMDFMERVGYTINSLGNDHFDEYRTNEEYVPENKREEVASNRVRGLKSIRDYIQNEGNNAQIFHLDASIIGAKLYASSLGIVTNPSKEGKKEGIEIEELKGFIGKATYNGKLYTGIVFEYYENGNVESEEHYKNGESHGSYKEWYQSGQLRDESTFKNNVLEGSQKIYSKNGMLVFEANKKNGQWVGAHKVWHENGQLKLEGYWDNKELISQKCWDEVGNTIICTTMDRWASV